MKLTIPTDQQLGHQLESIARTIATIIAFVYVAGFTFGQAIHWLSANLNHLLVNETRHVITHPAATNPDSNHSADHRRTPTTTRAKGFAS